MNKHKSRGKGVPRPGSGRTKGSNSFVLLTLADLTKKFADPNQKIQVGRKWAEMQGYENLVSTDAKSLYGKLEGSTQETEIKDTEVKL